MYKDFRLWYDWHPEGRVDSEGEKVETGHETVMYSAGGFEYLCCNTCHVSQTIDEIDALTRHVEPDNEKTRLFVAPNDGHVHSPEPVEKVSGAGVVT